MSDERPPPRAAAPEAPRRSRRPAGRRPVDPATVVAAARRCIAEKGFLGADVDEIAAAAGISRATLYRRAGGRRALVRDVLLVECVTLMDHVAASVEAADDGAAAVEALVRGGLEAIGSQPVLARVAGDDVRAVLNEITVDAAPLIARLVSLLAPIVERAAARGLLAPRVPAAEAAEEVVRFVLGRLHTPVLGGGGLDPGRAAERALPLFGPLLGVTASGASGIPTTPT